MLGTTGTRRQRVFWAIVGSAWIALLAVSIGTHAEHPLVVVAWGVLIAVLGIGMLIDHDNVVAAQRRSMPRGLSLGSVRSLVTLSGGLLTLVGILACAVGFMRFWR